MSAMSDLSLELYKGLYLIRKSEEHIVKYYPENDMKTPMHMSMGQEAIPVGVCQAIGSKGQVLATYRSHATFLAKTGDTDRFFAELYGKVSGTAQGKAGSMHLAAPDKGHLCSSAIVASCIPVAVGAAFANKQKANDEISCVFFGDGALDEGSFWESVNVASALKLPVLFVCEDNGFSVHTPTTVRQGYKHITDVVAKFNCNVFQMDTTDVEIIYHLATQAIDSIKLQGRPAFIHLRCYRYLEHVGIHEDYDAGYRSRNELDEWYKRDCVLLQRQKLLNNGCAHDTISRLETAIDQQIDTSIQRAREAAFPQSVALFKGVFHETD